jgi:hypothetical protein
LGSVLSSGSGAQQRTYQRHRPLGAASSILAEGRAHLRFVVVQLVDARMLKLDAGGSVVWLGKAKVLVTVHLAVAAS